ncbi:MAG: FAD-dependent oxidoreductase [Nitrospirota bacterium]
MSEAVVCYWNHKMQENALPLRYADKEVAAVIGWGGVQIFKPDVDIIDLCYEYSLAIADSSCGQCIPCRVGTSVLSDIFERFAKGKGKPDDLHMIRALSETISRTSRCEIGRSSPAVFLYLLDHYRRDFEAAANGKKSGRRKYHYRSIKTAPCMQACPIHLDIPKYIEAIRLGKFREALDIIRQKLPLPGVVGRVCVRPCESNCRRGLLDEPLQIKHLKRFVADYAADGKKVPRVIEWTNRRDKFFYELARTAGPQLERKEANGIKVAIVGAGPAGLTCAYFLAHEGFKVTIYDMLPEPGGMAAVGIPDYRLPRHVLQDEIKAIEKLGVKIVCGKSLGAHFTLDYLDKEGYKAVFIGMGCHCHKKMGIEGEDEGYYGYIPGVHFLRSVNLGFFDELPKGKRMVVVGGGNVAIDCVRSAFRVGFDESHLVYRRSRKEMPADPVEITDAEAEGVNFHFLTAPKRIIGENGKVVGLECLRMELGEPDASGRRRPVEVPGSEFVIPAEVIVSAIGQEGDSACICKLPGVEVNKRGGIIVDGNLMTTRRGVFAGGDCVTGPDVLIRACAQGRRVALKIAAFLKEGKIDVFDEERDEAFLNTLQVFDPSEHITVPGGQKRVPIKHEPSTERKKDFREVDKGFTPQEAMAEAERCLRCYRVVTYATIK